MTFVRWQPLVLAVATWLVVGCAATPTPPPTPAVPALPTTAQAGDATVIAVGAPAAPCCKQTLPEFLGITGLAKLACGGLQRLRNRLGMVFPGLEPGPPVLAITDPANSDPNQPPAVQSAAAIKAEEDAAPQKVKAIRFLAGVGCAGCYPDVEESLLAALDDCTESVRYEAVKAFRSAADNPCQVCRCDSCCSPEVLRKLNSVAHETTASGCYKEPSARVRRVARLAMNACGGPVPTAVLIPNEGPAEIPEEGVGAPPEGPVGATAANQESLTLSSAMARLCSNSSQGSPSSQTLVSRGAVAASVDGERIFWSEILARVKPDSVALSGGGAVPNAELRERRLRDELNRVIDNRLLSQEARRRMHPNDIARVFYEADSSSGPGEFSGSIVTPTTSQEKILADAWRKWCVHVSPELSRQEMYDYYRANFESYRDSGYVRWEQLSARFDRYASPQQADRALSYVRVKILGGDPDWPGDMDLKAIETVTREASSFPEMPDGVIGRALTTLPVGQTSSIFQTSDGLHLVRVLQRSTPRTRSLDEVIDTVRNDILQQRHSRALHEHLQELRNQTEIWIAPAVPVAQSPLHHMISSELRALPPVEEESTSGNQQVQASQVSGQGDEMIASPRHPLSRLSPQRDDDVPTRSSGDHAPAVSRQIVIPQQPCNCH